ncbi:hypothetical protein IEQ34_019376 [Dendrobium chrysotoxum]|uniref:Uncharacterized protein n=1 Tax=Dendrobium chrysotoxum TaxID=161865 RepID=A0AAV7G8L7_DENCH|nr:hypothetical protein IEQ34_019376 [Dendrobium chrysotoxum]
MSKPGNFLSSFDREVALQARIHEPGEPIPQGCALHSADSCPWTFCPLSSQGEQLQSCRHRSLRSDVLPSI